MQRPTSLKAVIFDLDGTLVDTAEEFVIVIQALLAEHGLAPMDPVRIRASVSNGARSLVRLALNLPEGTAENETQRLRLLELYSEVVGTVAALYPGISELLIALEQRGIGWGIATNKPRLYTDPLLARLSTPSQPTSVVCPDDVIAPKPHPGSLLRNCRELGCAPAEAIYIGDHLRDIEAGRGAGIYTIAAAYGYIEPGDDPYSWGADAHADRSTDLHKLILGN